MSSVCFIQTSEYSVADLFLPARLLALIDVSRVRANEGVLVPL